MGLQQQQTLEGSTVHISARLPAAVVKSHPRFHPSLQQSTHHRHCATNCLANLRAVPESTKTVAPEALLP